MRTLLTLLVVVSTILNFTGCASSRSRSGDPNVLIIATDATFPPFHFEIEAGEATGYDVELARELARRANYEPQVEIVRPYEALWEGLANGEFDVVAATTGITVERQEIWLFTEPYYTTCQVAVVRTGANEPRILKDLNGAKVGAAGSGTSWLAAQSIRGAEAIQLGKGQAGVPALITGNIDALVVDEYEGVRAARDSGGTLRVISEPVALEQYAIVLPKSARTTQARLNRAFKSMQSDGSLTELQRRFGLNRPMSWPVHVPGE